MSNTDVKFISIVAGGLIVVVLLIGAFNSIAWEYYNDSLEIIGSEMSEAGFEEFMENEQLYKQ